MSVRLCCPFDLEALYNPGLATPSSLGSLCCNECWKLRAAWAGGPGPIRANIATHR